MTLTMVKSGADFRLMYLHPTIANHQMVQAIYLGHTNEQWGDGLTSVPDTPIALGILDYGSPVGHEGAIRVASLRTNEDDTDNARSIMRHPPSSMFSCMYFIICDMVYCCVTSPHHDLDPVSHHSG